MLIRYWFPSDKGLGFGVTAHSLRNALDLLAAAGYIAGRNFDSSVVVKNVDVSALDQNHVVTNMGPIVVRGVWFPSRNI
jgi:hypothetical protein